MRWISSIFKSTIEQPCMYIYPIQGSIAIKLTLLLPTNPIIKPLHASLSDLSLSIQIRTSFKSFNVNPLSQFPSKPFLKDAVITILCSANAFAIEGWQFLSPCVNMPPWMKRRIDFKSLGCRGWWSLMGMVKESSVEVAEEDGIDSSVVSDDDNIDGSIFYFIWFHLKFFVVAVLASTYHTPM